MSTCEEKLKKRTPRCNFPCIFPSSDSVLFQVSSFLTSYIILLSLSLFIFYLFFLKPTFPIPTFFFTTYSHPHKTTHRSTNSPTKRPPSKHLQKNGHTSKTSNNKIPNRKPKFSIRSNPNNCPLRATITHKKRPRNPTHHRPTRRRCSNLSPFRNPLLSNTTSTRKRRCNSPKSLYLLQKFSHVDTWRPRFSLLRGFQPPVPPTSRRPISSRHDIQSLR